MKKKGILNRDIAALLATLGHTDTIVIADCGLPVPKDVPCIDVSLKHGEPSFALVLETIIDDMEIEAITIAEEMEKENPQVYEAVTKLLGNKKTHAVIHEQFKTKMKQAKAVIRTGEATPYANIILQAGVLF